MPSTAIAADSSKTVFIKMVLSAWDNHNNRITKLIDSLSDEELEKATSPGRNSGYYLLGHLVAVSDGMFTVLGLGERLYPALDEIFLHHPEQAGKAKPTLSDLRGYWTRVNAVLSSGIASIADEEWFTRHNSVSAEDFAKEPHRNKLNIIINRTNHSSYHLGQLIYLSKQLEQA